MKKDLTLTLRPATIADALMLLEWRNDEETRRQSVNMDKVLLETHLPWLEKVIANPNRKLMIAELEGTPVGTVRLDIEEPRSELSWTIAPKMRGKGFGTLMVIEAVKYFNKPLKIIIKPGNLASFKVAEKAGFKKINETADMTNWIHDK
ncbi:MAG: GNAT family N-acetyltransferase [Patescibacteria group bacterium]